MINNEEIKVIKRLCATCTTFEDFMIKYFSIDALIKINEDYNKNKKNLNKDEASSKINKIFNLFSPSILYIVYNSELILIDKQLQFKLNNSKLNKEDYDKILKLVITQLFYKKLKNVFITAKVKLRKIVNKVKIDFHEVFYNDKDIDNKFKLFLTNWGGKKEFEVFKNKFSNLKLRLKKDTFSLSYLRYLYVKKILELQVEHFDDYYGFEPIKNKINILNIFNVFTKIDKQLITKLLSIKFITLN